MSALEKPKFRGEDALKVAEQVHKLLAPFCERSEIVGSLRRRKPLVGDIEILFVPHLIEEPDGLFEKKWVSLAHRAIEQLLKEGVIAKRKNVNGSEMWGSLNMLAVHVASGIPLDLFATAELCWPMALTIRTGGKQTNIELTTAAIKRGMQLHAYGSGFTILKTGQKIACHTEQDVFEVAGVPYLQPHLRK